MKSESEVAQSCPTLRDPMDCSLPGSSVSRQEYWSGVPLPSPQEGIKHPLISQCCLLTMVILRSSNSECYVNLRCKRLVMQEADYSFHSMKLIMFHSLEVLQKVKKKEGRRVGRRKEGRKGSHSLEKLSSLQKFWGL